MYELNHVMSIPSNKKRKRRRALSSFSRPWEAFKKKSRMEEEDSVEEMKSRLEEERRLRLRAEKNLELEKQKRKAIEDNLEDEKRLRVSAEQLRVSAELEVTTLKEQLLVILIFLI
jgi:transcription initiation factor IIF auxiliary subunit